jgi:hypothetical protein
METEKYILNSKIIEVASYPNYKEATFLISVLGEPDAYNRIIPEDAGEKYCETIIGYPVVAKLKKNIFGQPSDFEGHDVYEVKAKNGKKVKRFGTTPIGSILSSWVEERELDDFDEPKKCILCSAKLWSSRFPEYFKVFDKLWESGNVSTSWELTATKVEEKDGFKIYKVFEFISNCILGSTKTPAVKQAGVIEYAEFEDYETELADALEKDIADFDIQDNEEKEAVDLAEMNKNKEKTSVDETTEKNTEIAEAVEEPESVKDETTECADVPTETTVIAEEEKPDEPSGEETEVASLTDGDLFRKISNACRKRVTPYWGYISYWFPEEKTVWYKTDNPEETSLDYKLFTYVVENDEVIVSDPQDAKLTVSVQDINTVITEKEEKINAITAELEIKDNAIIQAGEKISKLNVEISELKPYKEAAEKAEQERIETEIAEAKENLKNTMLKTKMFTEEEINKPEIAELVEARNESAIKTLIAERYIASFDNDTSVADVGVASHEEIGATSVASLETDDNDPIDDNPVNFMKKLLTKK